MEGVAVYKEISVASVNTPKWEKGFLNALLFEPVNILCKNNLQYIVLCLLFLPQPPSVPVKGFNA